MRRVWALSLLLAAALGAGSGVAVGVLGQEDEPTPPSTFNDPLDLGVPLVDLDCTGAAVLVLGSGDSGASLRPALADNADGAVRYLRTDDSCPTLWAGVDEEVPQYVAYLGPFGALTEACEQRMTDDHARDLVTRLVAGNPAFVKCVCALSAEAAPVLEPDAVSTEPDTAVWVRALQGMLVDLDEERIDGFTQDQVSGTYDQTTSARIRELQDQVNIATDLPGVMGRDTWDALRTRACDLYDF